MLSSFLAIVCNQIFQIIMSDKMRLPKIFQLNRIN